MDPGSQPSQIGPRLPYHAIGANSVSKPANTGEDALEENTAETTKSVGQNVGLSEAIHHNHAIAGKTTEGAGKAEKPNENKGF
jgi:hypothetical protein